MSPAQQQPPADNHMGPMWLALGVFVVAIIVWLVFKKQLVSGFFYIKYAELSFVGLFTHKVDPLKQWISHANPKTVTFQQLLAVASRVGFYLKIPVAIVMLILGYVLFNRGVSGRFKTMYTMKTLLKHEIKNWPQSRAVMNVQVDKQDIDEGPWALAMTPMFFAKKHKLLKIQQKALGEGVLRKHSALTATLIKAKANQLFVKQLGPLWAGPDHLPMHIKALYAVFIARINGDTDAPGKLVLQIAASAEGGKLDFSGVKALLNKHKQAKIIQQICDQHAYTLTVLASLLDSARLTGVLPCSDFLWLKPIDRRLWFMLNGVGRQTPTTEVAGAVAHWKLELALSRPFRTPMIDGATKALELAIQEQVYVPEK
jgi:intracellular multiplication protein IcmP